MIGEKHDLAHELPEFKEKIHELKLSNRHFQKLFDEYDEIDHQVRRCEAEIEVHADDFVEGLKKRRLALKDDLFEMLKKCLRPPVNLWGRYRENTAPSNQLGAFFCLKSGSSPGGVSRASSASMFRLHTHRFSQR